MWPASILLGQWVARRWGSGRVCLQDKMVLELGAGCGLPALVAGKLSVELICGLTVIRYELESVTIAVLPFSWSFTLLCCIV